MQVAHPLLLRRGALRRLGAPPRAEAQCQAAVWPPPRRIVCLRLTCQLSSGTADDVVQAVIDRVHAAGPPPCIVVLDLRHTRAIDDDARRALQTLHDVLAQGQSRLRLAHPAAEARATLTTDGPLGTISPDDVHGSLRQALLAAYASLPGPALVTSATRRFLTEPPEFLSPLLVDSQNRTPEGAGGGCRDHA
jgi:MFS superfamily sulfate permease-like transporter